MVKTVQPESRFSAEDHKHMARALELAEKGRGLTSPNPMVGAVIVRNGKVLGEGYHSKVGQAHAEVDAIRSAGEDLTGATLYVTLEPCNHQGRTPPCTPLILEKGITRVVVPHADPNTSVAGNGFKRLRKGGVQVDVGLMDKEARRLNEAFLTFHSLKRPFMILKWAMTLDGRIAAVTGQSRWISNELSRDYVHEIRSNVDAVMVGIGTILQDNPMLNVRLKNYEKRQPKRIIVDGNLRIPIRAKVLTATNPGDCIIATSDFAPPHKITQLRDNGHHVLVMPGRRGLLDLRQLISSLVTFEIQSVLCEGGSSMHGSLLESRLVDKIIAFAAPKIIGGDDGKSPVMGWGLPSMHHALTLEDVKVQTFGTDVCLEGYVPDNFKEVRPLTGKAKPVRNIRKQATGRENKA